MLSKVQATMLVENEMTATHEVEFYKEVPTAYVFVCKNRIKDAIPDKIIAAINKESGNMAYSVYDVDAAVARAK